MSSEVIQQGGPLGPMLFCLTIHELVSSLLSEFIVFYLKNSTMGGDLDDLMANLQSIEELGWTRCVIFIVSKLELISHDWYAVDAHDLKNSLASSSLKPGKLPSLDLSWQVIPWLDAGMINSIS